MIVAIHQPNYAPWLGYFRKIATADHFIFLDDAAYSKGSVINRVRILENGKLAWLTIPVKVPLGTAIQDVMPAQLDWPQRHLSRLQNAYCRAAAFNDVWPDVEDIYQNVAEGSLAAINSNLILKLCDLIGITTNVHFASTFQNPENLKSDDRLISLIQSVPDVNRYLSGSGGRKYQDEGKFNALDIELLYNDYDPVPYPQTTPDFVAGLTVLDVAFNVGWQKLSELVQE